MKTKIIIGLSSLLLISVLIIILSNVFQKKQRIKITKDNDLILIELKTTLKDRENKIKEYKMITEKTVKYIPDNKKDKIILDQKKIIDNDTKIIDELQKSLDKTNKILKKSGKPKNSFSAFVLAGIDQKIELDIYIGLTYRRYLLNNHFFIGGGGAVKVYEKIGGSAIAEIGFSF